jgi:glucosamine--fructose-6-phosphate aminotransferase (isomerizing)
LAGDLRESTGVSDAQARALFTPSEWASFERVYLIGSGDSFDASVAATLAFETLAEVECVPVSAQRFADYGAAGLRRGCAGRTLVLAISVSGETPPVLQAVVAAREGGATTGSITATPGSSLSRATDRSILVGVDGQEPSPGVRSYQASLVSLLLVAIRLGEARRHLGGDELRRELVALNGPIEATDEAVADLCPDVADMIVDAANLVALGGGPSYGTARFAAAKVIESAGLLAVAQDLEEWWHAERFAYPNDMPVVIIAPPGRSRHRALALTAAATRMGRRTVVVARYDDAEAASRALRVLPVRGDVREEFSPLLYHVFAPRLACHVAQKLGRNLLQSDLPRIIRYP